MITRNFKLFLNAGKQIPLMINVSQYDHGEKWVFTLYDDNGQKYTPSTGAIVGIKADNKGIINTGTVNSAGQVEIMETQQMTAAAGKAVFELQIDGDTHGTANFVVLVEPKPGDQADMSTSDLSLLQQAINSIAIAGSGAPAVATFAADMTDEGKIYLYAGSEVGYTAGHWYYYNGASWVDGGKYGGVVDATLTQPGQAADAKKTGDEINDLKSEISGMESIPSAVKSAMDNMFAHALFKDYDASGDYAIFHSWVSAVNLLSISAVFTQGANVIYDSDSLDDLKQYLTVTANYDNGTSTTLSDSAYTLSGEMEEGTQTFTVSYDGKSDSFTADISYDSTPKLLTSGYYRYHVANADNTSESSYALQASTNAGVTVKYDFDPMPQTGETYQLCGIFPTGAYSSKDFYKATGKVASLLFFDAQGNHLAFLNELSTSTFNRWLQNGNSTMTEYVYQSVELAYDIGKIECQIDIRHLDDTYLYDGVTGHVFFAGRNTPYFGMHNISEASE